MNRRIPRIAVYFAAAILTFVGVRLAIPQAGSGLPETLAAYLPPNALMTVEAQDFAGLWRMWNAAPERQLWIASANRDAFLRSSLFYRLKDAQSEFAAAAKLAPDEALVQAVAGDATILAVYDIGALEVAYLTRMNRARATESALWQLRGDFEPREAAGQPYYVRSDEESGRTVAFAATDEYLILATREDLVASILENLASSATTDRLAASPWYRDASAASPGRGGLRLVLDISRLASTPHFRSYWVQQNATELRQYTAGIVDLAPNGGAWEERRAFLRASEATSPAAPARAEATRLAALAPAGASLFRAWAEPDRAELAALVRRKILAPGNSAASIPADVAPRAVAGAGYTGTASDLESSIAVEPPRAASAQFDPQPIQQLLDAQPLRAAVLWQDSRLTADGAFVRHESTLILNGERPWDGQIARDSLRDAFAGLWTTGELGAAWVQEESGGQSIWRLRGLQPLAISMAGNDLAISTDPAALASLLGRWNGATAPSELAAQSEFRHTLEQPYYIRLMGALDFPRFGRRTPGINRPPALFSENIASLSRTLARIDRVRMETTEEPSRTLQQVTYQSAGQ